MRTVVYGYSGPLVNVLNSTTKVATDLFAPAGGSYMLAVGSSSGVAYTTWLGSATGYVMTW